MSDELVHFGRSGRTLEIPVFDAHSHVGLWAMYDMVALADQVAEMDRLGVRVAAVSGLLALSGEFRRGNDYVAEVVRRYPGRFLGYVHVSARYPEQMLPELERCFATGAFRGIKVYQVGVEYEDALFEPVWKFAAERAAPVLAHTWGNAAGMEKIASRYPQAAFMVAHSGVDGIHVPYIKAVQAAPNLYLDLTYSREFVNLIEHFVEQIGADRIVWGADVPLFSMAQQLSKVLFARISDADKKKILYYNAARLFGLPLPG